MERRIDQHAPLDYVELQIFPSDNRYEACVSTSNIIEKVASGDLQQLLLHLPQVKDLSSKTSDSNFRILTPDDASNVDWFTIATLTRFLNIVGSPDVLSIGNEISQLEETRKFQLSLFAKAEVDMTTSFESKNELLRAVDSRLSGLKEQLAEALNQATGITCSPQDISNLENFAHHFGAEDIRDSLQKFLELSQFPSSKDSTPQKSVVANQPSQLNLPVKYGVSPAKAAQVERQSSTDSENSFSSEDDQPTVERSRPIARSATPRRLASPMRRVQIGRTGPRRAATISIKSLNYFPNREKLSTQKDATCHSSDEEEDSETPAKKNALRMSVQDKISLFENKQKEKAVETEKTVSTAPVATKAVLRRWSSGMSQSTVQIQNDTVNKTSSPSNPEDGAPGGNAEALTKISPSQSSETSINFKSSAPKKVKADILNLEMENSEDEHEESREKHPASIQWNQQKEAELNQLFKKMMESKPVRRHSVTNDNRKSKINPKEQRGGFYDHYKQKREEKLQKEASGKKAEKESQFKEMEKFLDEKKAEMASTNTNDSREKTVVNKVKPQNSQKNPTQLQNTKRETSKGSMVKKATTTTTNKLSPLPATRKSWPTTTPSPRPAGSSPAKTPSGPASSIASVTRKPQTTSSAVRSSTKVEKSKPQPKTLKSTPPDGNKNIKTVKEKKQPTVTKSAPIAKSKTRTPVGTPNAVATTTTASATAAKPSFYNKVTKKSSVVPLETKPFLRKGTGIGPGVGPVVKSKVVAQPEEQLDSTGDMIQAEKNQAVEVETTEIISESQNQETDCEPPESCTESEAQLLTPIKCEEPESFKNNRFNVSGDDVFKKTEIEEDSTILISPTAWVEVEENNQDEIIPCKESPTQASGPANLGAPAGASSPRVRHSLFQMLLEETTSEADSCEWGNAQHPPAMVNQKDAPKGFKRLLKFARKTKADLNLTDGSSPSSIFRRG